MWNKIKSFLLIVNAAFKATDVNYYQLLLFVFIFHFTNRYQVSIDGFNHDEIISFGIAAIFLLIFHLLRTRDKSIR